MGVFLSDAVLADQAAPQRSGLDVVGQGLPAAQWPREPEIMAGSMTWAQIRRRGTDSGSPVGLGREALAATALAGHVRVAEHELFVQALLEEVDLSAVDQGQAVGIDVDADAL